MHQSMTELAGHFPFGVAFDHGPAGSFQGMADDLPQRCVTIALVFREPITQFAQGIADHLGGSPRSITGEITPLEQVLQMFIATVMPLPFFDLEPQAIDLLVKKSQGVGVAADHPAIVGLVIQTGMNGVVHGAGGCAAGSEPGEVVGVHDQQAVATGFLRELEHGEMFGFDIVTAARFGSRT